MRHLARIAAVVMGATPIARSKRNTRPRPVHGPSPHLVQAKDMAAQESATYQEISQERTLLERLGIWIRDRLGRTPLSPPSRGGKKE